jgi:hypothetical protein
MPNEVNTGTQQTDDSLQALKPALASMALQVAAVIVHDKAASSTTSRLRVSPGAGGPPGHDLRQVIA